MADVIVDGFTCPVDWDSVQFSSVAQSCLTLCHPMNVPSLQDGVKRLIQQRSAAEFRYLRTGSEYPKFQEWLIALRFNGKSLCWSMLFILTMISDNCSYRTILTTKWQYHLVQPHTTEGKNGSGKKRFTFRLLTLCKVSFAPITSLSFVDVQIRIYFYFIFGCAALSSVGGHHPIYWGPEWTERLSKVVLLTELRITSFCPWGWSNLWTTS